MVGNSDPDGDVDAAEATEQALAARLRTAAPLLLSTAPPPVDPDPAADAASILDLLVASVAEHPANDRIWLLLTSISAAYPTRSDVDGARRAFELLDQASMMLWLLDAGLTLASLHGEPTAAMDVIVGRVVVDVDHTAKFDLHTGIQRVSRSLLPLWKAQHDVIPVAWTSLGGTLRRLTSLELARVLDWFAKPQVALAPGNGKPRSPSVPRLDPPRLVVPWRSVLVMVEVPPGEVSDRVAAIGDYSGNHLVGVAHDAIPVVSADMVPSPDSSKFVRYLTSVKFAARMAGVSAAAAAEIGGFVQALATQGIAGPKVVEVALGSPSTGAFRDSRPRSGIPTVLVVGSHEPRKNHLAILHAAEILWREGLEFSLVFIGGSGWGDEFPRRTAELQAAGRPINVRRAVPEMELERAYASASFTVFPSLHEGFGLPVAESLAHGTPVITSDFGSTAETGGHGGALLVDPRDDRALTAAMRTLLCDPAELERLRRGIDERPERTWQDYADELWEMLVEPELISLSGGPTMFSSIAERFRRRSDSADRGPDDLAADIDRFDRVDPRVGVALRQRMAAISATTLPSRPPSGGTAAALTTLIESLTPMTSAGAWLTLAVIDGRLPSAERVGAIVRLAELDGSQAAVLDVISQRLSNRDQSETWPDVRILIGKCLVDVQHTSRADFATGIQRVTREVTRRWYDAHHPILIGWRDDMSGMRELTAPESNRARWGGPPVTIPTDDPIIVPWNCTYILPELAAEVVRAAHLQNMAQNSGTTLNMIGYDLVPITTAETSHEGLVPGFARNLAAARYARVIAPISVGAAGEYRGWRSMLAGTGLTGPRIEPVVLPTEAPPEDPVWTATARRELLVGSLPLVLVVGSHEPRKNHLAVLHAAELLWREGHLFSITFIGGNSWNSETFTDTLAQMQGAGRPVEAISAATDALLWGGYRIARFTVFPSLNEGFGLPVAESLSCGTPVVTSGYGSMKEIADDGGGAVLVNPRDDHSLADGMRTLLTDQPMYARLAAEANARPRRTWDAYAAETWDVLMSDPTPS